MTTRALTLPRLDPHFIYAFDALGSLVFGVVLLAAATPLTDLAGWELPASLLWWIGLLLVPWAAFNLWIVRSTRPGRVAIAANIIGDVVWVAGSLVLLALHASSLSPLGIVLLTGQGIAVAGVLALKLMGARALA